VGILERVSRAMESRAINNNVFFDLLQDRKTHAGKNITPTSALEGTVAVYTAVSLLAETVGSLPLHTYKRISEDERERITPVLERWPGGLARMLHDGPNPELTGQEFWETVEGHLNLWGNHYSFIVRGGDGRPKELWPLRPDMMEVFRARDREGLPIGARQYAYTLPNGEKRGLTRPEVFHVPAFGINGIAGISRAEVGRNAIGIEQAAGEYAGRFFSNSAIPGGILKTAGTLKKDTITDLRDQWSSMVGGLTNAQRIAVLHSGVDWQSVGIPPKDAQFIELRRFQIEEVARLFRIPLHLLGDTSKETTWGTGIEQMTIGFVVYTLRSHLKRIESAIERDLGDPQTGRTLRDEGLFAEFRVDGLLRGDMEARAGFYASGIQNGWMLRSDARGLENLKPVPGLDRPLMAATHNPVGADGLPIKPEPPPQLQQPADEESARAHKRRLLDEAYRKSMDI
jgi:HK97 family phage portal protein